jgi:hypothetical protein
MEPTLDEFAAAYAEYGRSQSEDHFWAVEWATMLAFEQQWDRLWELTLRAIEITAAEDTAALAFIAAGPLEDLVRYAAPVVHDRVVARIRTDAKFRRTLTGVWARTERAEFWQQVEPLLREYPTDPIDADH